MRERIVNNKPYLLFIVLSTMGVLCFYLIPYLDVFRRAFFNTTGSRFVGVENFLEIFENDAFKLALLNSMKFIIVCIPLLLITSFAIAVFLYSRPRLARWMKPGFLIPMAIPVASVVLIWRLFFDRYGLINGILSNIGLEVTDWMNSDAAFWVLVMSYIWKNLGYNIILWLAGLSTISDSMYEAARIDGANEIQILIYVTIPNIIPSICVITILALLNSFKVFRESYLISGEYPHRSMYMVQNLFNNWFRDLSLDKMAAGAVVISVFLVICILALLGIWDRKEGK